MKTLAKLSIIVAALVLTACGSTKVVNIPSYDFPVFPELFITVHNEQVQELNHTTVPDKWLDAVKNFYAQYQDLQKRYTAEKATNADMPEVTFPQAPELLITVHNNDVQELGQTAVSDDWLYKMADFYTQYQDLQRKYQELKAAAEAAPAKKGKK